MDWFVSIQSIIILILTMRKWKYAPVVGFLGQFSWTFYAIHAKQYGLLPCTIAFTFVYAVSIKKWLKEGQND